MDIGVVKEIMPGENRVGMTPYVVSEVVKHGHTIYFEEGAGEKSGYSDKDYYQAGAHNLSSAESVFCMCDMIVHVKEPLPQEWTMIDKGHTILSYFHFASSVGLIKAMNDRGAKCVAYETIVEKDGSLPMLEPMSVIAGKMAVIKGIRYLEVSNGGVGQFVCGLPGMKKCIVLIIGAGIAGTAAMEAACALGATVFLFDNDMKKLNKKFPPNCVPIFSTLDQIAYAAICADLVIGAVHSPGAKPPILLAKETIAEMKDGSVIVDISIDQGGCFETSRPTTHANPTYKKHGVTHYCVPNIPGDVPRTASDALSLAALPYIMEIANNGTERNEAIHNAVNIENGYILHPEVKKVFAEHLGETITKKKTHSCDDCTCGDCECQDKIT
jgi:alanine dehydrogenase